LDIGNNHRAVRGKHHIEDGAGARLLSDWLTPVRLDPNAALIAKAEQNGISLKVLSGKPCNGVKNSFRLCV
jgi:16S rRNA C1402 (ribose-2'-O) methylase RsmI